MANVMRFSDIVEENGKTIRENNLATQHTIPVGTLVEYHQRIHMANDTLLEGVVQGYVWSHSRDCDGSPLYTVCNMDPDFLYRTAFNIDMKSVPGSSNYEHMLIYIEDLMGDKSRLAFLALTFGMVFSRNRMPECLTVISS